MIEPEVRVEQGGMVARRGDLSGLSALLSGHDNGDGIGDLPGITRRLDHIARLGVDAIWLSPFFKSPMADMGYDVSDYCDVDPMFGTLADFDALLDRGAPARAQGHHRPGDLAHLRPASLVQGKPLEPHQSRRPTGMSGPIRSRMARAPNNWLSIFGGRPGSGTACAGNITCTISSPRSRTSTSTIRRCRMRCSTRCASGSSAASTASGSIPSTTISTTRSCATIRRCRDADAIGLDAPDVNPYGMQNHLYDKTPAGKYRLPQALPRAARRVPRHRASVGEVGDGHTIAEDGGRLYRAAATSCTCATRSTCSAPDFTATHFRSCVERVSGRRHRRLGLLGLLQPRRDAPCQPLRADGRRAASAVAKLAHLPCLRRCAARSASIRARNSACRKPTSRFEDLRDPYGIRFWPAFKGRDGCRTPMVVGAGA